MSFYQTVRNPPKRCTVFVSLRFLILVSELICWVSLLWKKSIHLDNLDQSFPSSFSDFAVRQTRRTRSTDGSSPLLFEDYWKIVLRSFEDEKLPEQEKTNRTHFLSISTCSVNIYTLNRLNRLTFYTLNFDSLLAAFRGEIWSTVSNC